VGAGFAASLNAKMRFIVVMVSRFCFPGSGTLSYRALNPSPSENPAPRLDAKSAS
jgi:hypothetical protein